jgi:sec-independent protein translocase protein TatB
MFDMGVTEMMLIGIVALVVIGPERLPGVARTAGKYFTRLRNFMMNVRADVESELKADELREMLKKQGEELSSLKDVVNEVGKDLNLSEDIGVAGIKKSIEDAMPDLNSSLDPEPIAETRPAAKASVKANSKKKPSAKKKASAKTKATPKAKVTPKKSKAAPKATVKAAPKKAKATAKTKTATKARVKPKTVTKRKAKTDSDWTGSIASPGGSGDADQS